MSRPRDTSHATSTDWERLAMLAGIGFIVALLASIFSAPSLAGSDATLAEFADRYAADSSQHLTSTAMTGVAAVFFLGFLGGLASLLRRSEDSPGVLSLVAIGSGVASIVLVLAAQATYAAAALVADVEGIQPDVVRGLDTVVFTLMQFSGFPRVAFLGAAALIMLRSANAPNWLGWLALAGAIVGAIGLGGVSDYYGESILGLFAFLGVILFAVWILATSVVYLRRGERAPVATPATST
ncbi:MAG TPA: hypothetical protein VEX37_01470 [Thermomicrobiales bacterium]|nr:hypothetical protein [Thermomicrobiales bacterium]